MKTLAKIGPFGFTNLMFNHLFDELFDEDIQFSKTFVTSKGVLYNLIKKDDAYELEFNIAGYSKDKVMIDVKENELIVSYDDTQPETDKVYVFKTFPDKSFKKVFNLTDIDIKNIKATHDDGVLRIVLPKTQEKVSQRIEIT